MQLVFLLAQQFSLSKTQQQVIPSVSSIFLFFLLCLNRASIARNMRKRHCPPDDDYTHGGSLDGSNRGRSTHKSFECCRSFFFPTYVFALLAPLVCNTAYIIKLFILGVVESKRWKDNDSTSFSLCRNTTHRGIASFCFSVFHLSCLKRFTKKKKENLDTGFTQKNVQPIYRCMLIEFGGLFLLTFVKKMENAIVF